MAKKYLKPREASEYYGVSLITLRKLGDNGDIKQIKLPSGHRRYPIEDENSKDNRKQQSIVCYCRVSSSKQKADLARQVAYMRGQFPKAEIIKDVGSGLNFKRQGLKTILERLRRGDKFTLIVAHRDRLVRFGFELFEYLFEQNGGELMVLEKKEYSPEQEITSDILSILHVYSCRINGMRRYHNQIKKDTSLPQQGSEESI